MFLGVWSSNIRKLNLQPSLCGSGDKLRILRRVKDNRKRVAGRVEEYKISSFMRKLLFAIVVGGWLVLVGGSQVGEGAGKQG